MGWGIKENNIMKNKPGSVCIMVRDTQEMPSVVHFEFSKSHFFYKHS